MSGNIILKADFLQPFIISVLQLFLTASAPENMASGLRQIVENHGSQYFI
jgi:hypothetical protein